MVSTASASDLTRLVPGFDFLQGLMKTGGAGLPNIGQWIAPTLEPEELQKRIDELKTVQFWLEQNSKLLGTTIQALEVQRMTLATLKGMNLPLADLASSLTLRMPKIDAAPAKAAPTKAAKDGSQRSDDADEADDDRRTAAHKPPAGKPAKKAAAPAAAAIDPMQWWGALTQQFTELATKAMREGSADMARNIAGSVVKQGLGGAGNSIERAMAMSGKAAGLAAKTATAAAGVATAATKAVAGAAAQKVAGAAGAASGAGGAAARRRKR